MLQLHLGDCLRDPLRFGWIKFRRPTVRDGAIGAISGADVTEDHERCGAVLPAFANVRTMSLLANSMEVELTHELLEPEVVRTPWSSDFQPTGLTLRQRLDAMTPDDLIKSLAHRFGISEGAKCHDGNRKSLSTRNLSAVGEAW